MKKSLHFGDIVKVKDGFVGGRVGEVIPDTCIRDSSNSKANDIVINSGG